MTAKQEALIKKALRIQQGLDPNVVTETNKSAGIVSMPALKDSIGARVDSGKVVVDPINVKNARYNTQAAKELILFHTDFVSFFIGSRINFIMQLQSERVNPQPIPLFRLEFDRPIFNCGNPGSKMERSLLGVFDDQVGRFLVNTYIGQWTMVMNYTKKQRDDYKRKTNKDLLDQYWQLQRWELSLPDFNKFNLFLPTGMDCSYQPWVRPDGVIEMRKTEPQDKVVLSGYKTLTEGSGLVL